MAKPTRAEETRTKAARPTVWQPPSTLDAPPAPEGFAHRWLRMEINGADDRKNLNARLREGYELVRAEEHPDWDLPTINDGKHSGVIAVGGLVLGRIPIDLAKQRDEYYRKQAENQQEAVDNDFLRENNPTMPLQKPERQSRVTFGGSRTG